MNTEKDQVPQCVQTSVSDSTFRYCWLNINDGKFSNSWDQKTQDLFMDDSLLEIAKKDGWKLIKYECLTDEKFEFYNKMKLR